MHAEFNESDRSPLVGIYYPLGLLDFIARLDCIQNLLDTDADLDKKLLEIFGK